MLNMTYKDIIFVDYFKVIKHINLRSFLNNKMAKIISLTRRKENNKCVYTENNNND